MKKLLTILILVSTISTAKAEVSPVGQHIILCKMYANAMVFDNRTNIMNFLNEELTKQNVYEWDEKSFRIEVRKMMKAMKTSFDQEMLFYKNSCKKIGLIK